jgi:oligopeptide/dipeptide ABC transporter ATP-binding protein
MTAAATALEISDLHIDAFRDDERLPLVEGVELRVSPGEVCGIVGESGAGKTLTVRALLGLLPSGMVARGEIAFDDRPARLGDRRADTGVVLQNPASMLDPLMVLGKQLTEAVVYHGAMTRAEAVERAKQLLVQMGFADPSHVLALYPHQLSGGMAQRAALAMALMPSPRVLVVDEPTSALDANLRTEVLRVVRALAAEQQCAIVLVSHDLSLVGTYCDSMAVMYAGRVVESGPATALLSEPQHPYTKALVASAASSLSPPRTPLPVIKGSAPRPGEWPEGCVFAPRCKFVFDRCVSDRPALQREGARRSACFLAFSPALEEDS